MWQSEIIDLATVYYLTHYPATPTAPSGGSWSAPAPSEPTGGVTFGVHLAESGRGNPRASLGYDPTEMDVDGVVVETPYNKPSLPDGVGAGSTFAVVFQGKQGTLTIGAAPPSGFADVEDELGEAFSGRWVAG
jgi:hypothetical protein